jgi:hypothetical protein
VNDVVKLFIKTRREMRKNEEWKSRFLFRVRSFDRGFVVLLKINKNFALKYSTVYYII